MKIDINLHISNIRELYLLSGYSINDYYQIFVFI